MSSLAYQAETTDSHTNQVYHKTLAQQGSRFYCQMPGTYLGLSQYRSSLLDFRNTNNMTVPNSYLAIIVGSTSSMWLPAHREYA